MDNDQSDRRDRSEPKTPPEPAAEEQEAAADATPIAREPGEATPDASVSAAEIESWPSQDASAGLEAPAEPSWPTEPPDAGSGDAGTWPTTAPEADAEQIVEPTSPVEPLPPADPMDAAGVAPAAEPPPGEVEAYPAAAPMDSAAAAAAGAHAVPAAESATGESTQCPRCGTENRAGLAFCRSCGQRLVAAGVATTVERPGTPEGTQACPRCGTHNRAGVAFCQNCGANLRGTAAGYVPPAAPAEEAAASVDVDGRGAVLGPVVLIIGVIGLVTGYLLPFLYGNGSLFERAFSDGGYGVAFWSGYPDVASGLADQAYFGLAAPVPLLGLVLLALVAAGFMRARPGGLQVIGLVIALVWSIGLIVLFVVVELGGNWDGDLVGMLRELTPAGIIFFLASLIVVIGALTRFGRS